MMRKYAFISFVLVGAAVSLLAANADGAAKAKELETLVKERQNVAKALVETRAKLIAEDPDLQKIHQQILNLHQDLAIRLNGKAEIRQLLEKKLELDEQIARLQDSAGK